MAEEVEKQASIMEGFPTMRLFEVAAYL